MNDNELKNFQEVTKSATVLFVEDDPLVSKEIGEVLSFYFQNVISASSSEEALETIQQHSSSIDVIITDIMLQQTDGLELLQILRKRGLKIPMFVITSHKSEELLMRAVTLKLSGYIIKPISLNALKQCVEICGKELIELGLTEVEIGKACYFDQKRSVIKRDEEKIPLTKNENRLLALAYQHRNSIITKEQIQEYVWGNNIMSDQALKNLLTRLRNKIGSDVIVTHKGIGYELHIDQETT